MSKNMEAEIDKFMEMNFPASRPARSRIYMAGFRACVAWKSSPTPIPAPTCPYKYGQVEFDAWFAGWSEAQFKLRR